MSCKEWKVYPLNEVIEFNPKESIKKGEISKKVSMDKLDTFKRKISGYEETTFTSGTKFRNGDTLLARITPCLENGKTAQVDILDDNEVGFGSTEFIVMREKKGKTINKFIYYLSISPEFRNIAIKSMTGSSGRQRVQKDVLENTEIALPSLEEQEKIANILSSLDDKIELNNEMNKTLEDMAQSIFKRWFVDFEFPNEDGEPYKSSGGEMVDSELGMIPKGWEVKSLGDICDVKGGKRLPKGKTLSDEKTKYPYLRVTDVTSGYVDMRSIKYIDEETREKISRYIIEYNDLYISIAGTIGIVGSINKKLDGASLTENMARIICNNIEKYYMRLYLNSDKIQQVIKTRAVGSTQPKLPLYAIKDIYVLVPNENIMDIFNKILVPLFQKVEENLSSVDKFVEMRDILLPKLMSGEIN